MKKFILIGDSLIEYGYTEEGKWVSMLSNLLIRRCDVINRGFAGYNSDDIVSRLEKILKEFSLASVWKVCILIGSNDSCPSFYQQHVSLDAYKQNLETMIDTIVFKWGLDKQDLLIITPPLKWHAGIKEPFAQPVTDYANVCVELARKFSLCCVDLNKAMIEYGEDYNELLEDGLHFSKKGSELVMKCLYDAIKNDMNKWLPREFE